MNTGKRSNANNLFRAERDANFFFCDTFFEDVNGHLRWSLEPFVTTQLATCE